MLDARCSFSAVIAALGALATAAVAQFDFEAQPAQAVTAPDHGVGRGVCCEMDGMNGPDIVVPTPGEDELVILLNDGEGGFAGFHAMDVGNGLEAAAAGDWDGDGLMDVLAIDASAERLHLVRQITPGDWEPIESRLLAGTPASLACADFDGDGLVDVAVGHAASGTVAVFINDGSGGLASLVPENYPMGDFDVACCDLDGDGDQDLVAVSQADGVVRVRLNGGAGTFGAAAVHVVGDSPSDVACCDLNGDGSPDLAVANTGDDTVSVLLNNGAGAFTPVPVVPAGPMPHSIACGDFDCDGDVDLIVANDDGRIGGELSGLIGDGNGVAWGPVESFLSYGGTVLIEYVLACEFDGEAGTDLVALEQVPFAAVRPFFNVGASCGSCIAPPPGSIAWYTGDLCTAAELHGNYGGTYLGLPFCPAHSKVGGGAIGFDDDPVPTYVEVPSDCELDPGDGDYTVNAWVRTEGLGIQPIATQGGAPGYALDLFDGRLRLVVCDSTLCWLTMGSSIISDGGWHHMAFTIERDARTTMRVWVDGVIEDTTVAAVGTLDLSDDLLLGAAPSPVPAFFLEGDIDELQVHERALEAGEIHAIYLAGIAGQCREVCSPTGDCTLAPEIVVFLGGAQDGFAPPAEPAVAGPELAALCAGAVDFDVVPLAGSVCHTFIDLPDTLVGGALEFRLRPGPADVTCNDTISLQATGGAPEFLWTRRLGAPGAGPCAGEAGLLDCPWASFFGRTFCLDLASLPEADGTTTSVIDSMATTGRLDVRVESDSGADFMRLRLALCPCPADLGGDGVVGVGDLVNLILSWGACPDPCPPCAADLSGDCIVDVTDMVLLIFSWGPC